MATAFAGSLNSMVAARLFMVVARQWEARAGACDGRGERLSSTQGSTAWHDECSQQPVGAGPGDRWAATSAGWGCRSCWSAVRPIDVPAVQLLLPAATKGGRDGGRCACGRCSRRRTSFATLMRDRNQVGCALMQASLFTGWSACLSVVPLYAAATWGASPSELGTLYSVAAVLGVAGAPLGGYVADFAGRKPAVMLGSLVVSASFASLPLVETKPQLLCAMAAMGLGESFLMSANAALANDVTPRELRGAQSALLSQVGDLTFVVMPVALSLVATNVSYSAGFLTASGLILGANTGFALLATEPSRKARRGGS